VAIPVRAGRKVHRELAERIAPKLLVQLAVAPVIGRREVDVYPGQGMDDFPELGGKLLVIQLFRRRQGNAASLKLSEVSGLVDLLVREDILPELLGDFRWRVGVLIDVHLAAGGFLGGLAELVDADFLIDAVEVDVVGHGMDSETTKKGLELDLKRWPIIA
jgi:hypothetical protein